MFNMPDFANALLANAYPRRAECSFPGCDDEPTHADRCIQHHAVKCGGCSQPATRRCAFDAADVCDDCGERSDASHAEMLRRDRIAAEREEV